MSHSHYDPSKPTRQSQFKQNNVRQQEREKTVILKDLWHTPYNPQKGQEEVLPDTDPSSIPVILSSAQYRNRSSHAFPAWSQDNDISKDEDDSSDASSISAVAPLCEEFARLRLEEKEKEVDADKVNEDGGLTAAAEDTEFYDEPHYQNCIVEAPEGRAKTPESSSDSSGENQLPIVISCIDENAESPILVNDESLLDEWPQQVEVKRELLPATQRADGSIRKARYKKAGYQNADDLAKERYVSMGFVEKKTEEVFEQKQILSKTEARMMVLQHYRPDIIEKEKAEQEIREQKIREEELEREKRVLEDYATIETGALSLLRNPPRRHVKLVEFVAPESAAIECLAKEILDATKKVQEREPRRYRMLLSHAGNVGTAGGALFPKKFIFFSDWVWELCRKKQKALMEIENNLDNARVGKEGCNSQMGKLS